MSHNTMAVVQFSNHFHISMNKVILVFAIATMVCNTVSKLHKQCKSLSKAANCLEPMRGMTQRYLKINLDLEECRFGVLLQQNSMTYQSYLLNE